ncbi:Uncharacterised protein [Escherichia coli]|uniref:Uncharacterized protein n=1 Tax=Escherichia coli TaxID=562 RepID=A0A376KY21_ECOLX|nr:Uncharacterised protein [Escherichia coli]
MIGQLHQAEQLSKYEKMLHDEYNNRLIVNNIMDDDMIHCINAVEDQEQLLSRIAEIRKDYYRSLTITNGEPNAQIKFLNGWINRVDDCLKVDI